MEYRIGEWLQVRTAWLDGCSWLQVRQRLQYAQVVDVRMPTYRSRKNKGKATDPIVTLLAECGMKRTCPRCGRGRPEHVHRVRASTLGERSSKVELPTTVDEIEEYLCCEDTT